MRVQLRSGSISAFAGAKEPEKVFRYTWLWLVLFFFFQAEDGIRDSSVTGVQTCALPISRRDSGRKLVQPNSSRRRRRRSWRDTPRDSAPQRRARRASADVFPLGR